MSFYLELYKAQNIERDEDGRPTSWRVGTLIEKFRDPIKFMDYVRDNASILKNAVAVTGSASLVATANGVITDQLKIAGVL